MSGVKVHHVRLRNTIEVFEIPDRPYPVPFLCSTCERSHINKAVHLRLNSDGDVHVAEESFEQIRPYLSNEWKVMRLEREVPPMTLGFEGRKEQFNIEFREVG